MPKQAFDDAPRRPWLGTAGRDILNVPCYCAIDRAQDQVSLIVELCVCG
jgi:hypothetical protein